MAKAKLKLSSVDLESLIALMPGHVYWKNDEGVYLGCNNLQSDSLGLISRHDIIGKTDYDLSPKEVADAFRQVDLNVMQSGIAIETEEIISLPDGDKAVMLSK